MSRTLPKEIHAAIGRLCLSMLPHHPDTPDDARAALESAILAALDAAREGALREAEVEKIARRAEAPGNPLREIIDRSYSYMRKRDDGAGWDGAEGLVRNAFRLGLLALAPRPAPAAEPARERPNPTHRCKVCGAMWVQTMTGYWSLWSDQCGECCDNAPMSEQIEPIADFRRLCDPGPMGEPARESVERVCAMDGLTYKQHVARGMDTDTDEHGPWRPAPRSEEER